MLTFNHLGNQSTNDMKILNIYNNAPLYREGIFHLIDKEFDSDWFFGKALGDIKQMDISKLRGKTTVTKTINLFGGKCYWQIGLVKQLFKKEYTHYVLLGEERNLSTWVFLILSVFFPKKKIYFWSHGAYGKEGKVKLLIERIFWSFIDGAVLYGNYAKRIMAKAGFKTNTYHVIHNSLNYERQLELRNSGLFSNIYLDHFQNDNPIIIFIGRLTKVKNLPMLVNAISILKERGQHYNLVFIGDGEEGNNLKSLVKNLNLEKQVWFFGECYDEKTNAELIYNADLCVAPGNIGLTAMHSMVFGTPVISHDNYSWQMPEFEAILPGESGDFYEYQNMHSLADTIEDWIRTKKYCRNEVRKSCYNIIDTEWNPKFQLQVFKKMLED